MRVPLPLGLIGDWFIFCLKSTPAFKISFKIEHIHKFPLFLLDFQDIFFIQYLQMLSQDKPELTGIINDIYSLAILWEKAKSVFEQFFEF